MTTNLTSVATIEEEEEGEEFALEIVVTFGIFIAIVIVVAIVGNVFTIAAFIKDRKLRTVYNIYIVNLAVTDLLLGCVSMPFYAVYTLKSYTWPFGYHFCKLFMVTDFTLCLEAVIIMIILSFDRLLLLKLGPRYICKETNTVAYIKIAISWVISFLLYSPAIIGWDIWTEEDTNEPGDCDVQFAHDFDFTITTAVIEFGIPFICISALNLIIYSEIRKRIRVRDLKNVPIFVPSGSAVTSASVSCSVNNDVMKKQTEQPNKPANGSKTQNVGVSVPTTSKDTQKIRAVRKDMKAAKSLGLLVIVFAVTWAPYTIATIIISACETCVNENVYEFLNWLLWTKAALNPFLYAYNNQRFREHFTSFLMCQKKHNRINMDQNVSTIG
ncbi:Histamine H4 receptor [Mizuhopecten yessoensis]|uniref:Histamine H4 receptor n=1 Tax=Mizuhopecten yessoensis TaxID=6573 RepID=A0A210PS14_MIZYE|nr:Histamine H4 receptor [Mizuhopecten yessoensis]